LHHQNTSKNLEGIKLPDRYESTFETAVLRRISVSKGRNNSKLEGFMLCVPHEILR
jgi:hypothetical protein